jgi:glycosyltransferase involved in cell wall biosynthesis
MRIALDVSIQGQAEPTGVERAQATLIAALARRPGLELLLCSPRPLPESLRDLGRPLSGRGRALPLALWREAVLPGELLEQGAELLHSPVAAVPLRAPCPTLATLHELPWVEHVSHGDDRWSQRARTALAARVCRRIVCVSERTRSHFVRAHPEAASRAVVVSNAVDPRFRTASAPRLAPAAAAPAPAPVLAVGRLRRKKNLGLLLEAFASAPSCAGRRLVLAGPDGDAARDLRARASRADLCGRVDFPGHVDDERLLALYQSAACVVFPSVFEGFGLPVLEAMACGTAVIASHQGAPPEVSGAACAGFDGRDPRALVAALDAVLLDARLAAELGERGRRQAASFSAERAAEATVAVYAQALAAA